LGVRPKKRGSYSGGTQAASLSQDAVVAGSTGGMGGPVKSGEMPMSRPDAEGMIPPDGKGEYPHARGDIPAEF